MLKSISIPIWTGPQATHLICINYDISLFSKIHTLTTALTKVGRAQPESLFANDWQEKVHVQVYNFIQERAWCATNLSTAHKKEIVAHLYDVGAFQEKKAADHVAKILHMGRATIFNYLREWKGL